MLYAIYAGLTGGFGGANFVCLKTFNNDDDANCYAEDCAREEFDSYNLSMFGIEHEIEAWIDYYVVEIKTEEQLMKLGEDENIDSDAICRKLSINKIGC